MPPNRMKAAAPPPEPAIAPDAPVVAPEPKAAARDLPTEPLAGAAPKPAPIAKPVPAPVMAGVAGVVIPPAPRPAVSAPKRDEPKPASQLMFKVSNVRNDDVLNVRSGPSSDFEVVAELPPGSRGIAITSAC